MCFGQKQRKQRLMLLVHLFHRRPLGKCVYLRVSVGSNPTLSAIFLSLLFYNVSNDKIIKSDNRKEIKMEIVIAVVVIWAAWSFFAN